MLWGYRCTWYKSLQDKVSTDSSYVSPCCTKSSNISKTWDSYLTLTWIIAFMNSFFVQIGARPSRLSNFLWQNLKFPRSKFAKRVAILITISETHQAGRHRLSLYGKCFFVCDWVVISQEFGVLVVGCKVLVRSSGHYWNSLVRFGPILWFRFVYCRSENFIHIRLNFLKLFSIHAFRLASYFGANFRSQN